MLSALLEHGHDIRVLELPKAPVPLHCMAVSAGYEQRLNEIYYWDGLQRGTAPFVVLQHTLVGEGRLEFAGIHHRLGPGDTMIVTAPHPHRYWLERGGAWEYFWLLLNGREALRLAREIIATRGPVLRPPSQATDRMAGGCLALLDRSAQTPGEASVAAYAALAALFDVAFAHDAEQRPDVPAAFRRVLRHVEDNLATPLQVERLAALAEMSRAHFVRRFTAAFGMAPSHWVLARRIERIERLLVATEMSVGDIARATGFAGPNYLAKAFRRVRGQTPLAYRAAGRRALD